MPAKYRTTLQTKAMIAEFTPSALCRHSSQDNHPVGCKRSVRQNSVSEHLCAAPLYKTIFIYVQTLRLTWVCVGNTKARSLNSTGLSPYSIQMIQVWWVGLAPACLEPFTWGTQP